MLWLVSCVHVRDKHLRDELSKREMHQRWCRSLKKSNRAHLDDVLLALAGRDEGSDAALVQHRQSQSDSLRRRLRAVTDRSNQKILENGKWHWWQRQRKEPRANLSRKTNATRLRLSKSVLMTLMVSNNNDVIVCLYDQPTACLNPWDMIPETGGRKPMAYAAPQHNNLIFLKKNFE